MCTAAGTAIKRYELPRAGQRREPGEAESLNLSFWLLLKCSGEQCGGGGVRPSFHVSSRVCRYNLPVGETPDSKPLPPTPKMR